MLYPLTDEDRSLSDRTIADRDERLEPVRIEIWRMLNLADSEHRKRSYAIAELAEARANALARYFYNRPAWLVG